MSIKKLTIVVDAAIPHLGTLISPYANVIKYPHHQITQTTLRHADAVFVRSVTTVDQTLLEGTSIKCVASATAGVDHIDQTWLAHNKIALMNSPGANAQAVAEYVLCTIAHLQKNNVSPSNLKAGIIGLGQVGRKVKQLLEAIGSDIICYDPLQPHIDSKSLNDFKQLDLLTVHTPLTTEGDYPTLQMITPNLAQQTHCLINTSRGLVVHPDTLSQANLIRCFDVWENEPTVNPALIDQADLATPHIAGYSAPAKLRACHQVACSVARFFNRSELMNFETFTRKLLQKKTIELPDAITWQDVVLAIYNPKNDSLALKAHPNDFEQQRKHYPLRHEFYQITIIAPKLNIQDKKIVRQLGINT